MSALIKTGPVIVAMGICLCFMASCGDKAVPAAPQTAADLPADINAALYMACENDDVESVRSLLAKGADPHYIGENDTQPLHVTSESQIAALLLKHGADPNAKNAEGLMPLHITMEVETSRLLIKAGAKINARDDTDTTALHYACIFNFDELDVIQFLVESGAEINAVDDENLTPLDVFLEIRRNRPSAFKSPVYKFLRSKGAKLFKELPPKPAQPE